MPPLPRRPLKVKPDMPVTALRTQRLQKGVSREELARVAGTSVSKLARMESGDEDNPPLRILNNCAIALGVQLEAVIDPEWRTWWNRYGGQDSPPDPDEFWHQRGRGTSES